ncbi:MAG: hypothetical protein E6H52_04175 [Betaproteobacteria bacterium]|nr:MAG: hypothetical protein E6H52_04175 [Betaproteobacteria bacterium]
MEAKEFLHFRLDEINQCLWRLCDSGDDERVLLTPKAFGVLRYLVQHAGRLVRQSELLDALWPQSYVQPEVLKHHVLEVRKALGDDPRNPRFIETLPRRGYRFIAPVSPGAATDLASETESAPPRLVGRSAALAALRDYLAQACRGQRQFVSVTGEPGIGKTALVDEFRRRAAAQVLALRVASGQCVEGFGSQEGYYPMLEALGQLCRGPGGESIVDTLAWQAPTWLVQFPALLKREHRETLQRELLGATRQRMLREIGDALETITATGPLLLVFEDLQWVDHSTVDLLSALARKRAPARLMLVATNRSDEMMPSDHPLRALKRDLLVRGLCHEIALDPLTEAEVTEYLAGGARGAGLPQGLAGLIHHNSGGNPLFMTVALDHLTRRGLISREGGTWQLTASLETIKVGVPENLRQMIETQIERLSVEEQRALEVASVAGAVFSVSISATAVGVYPDHFEDLYASLARRYRIVRPVDCRQFPDGSGSPRYEFVHGLYREVLYQRQSPRQRTKLHRSIGERLETLLLQPSSHIGVSPRAESAALRHDRPAGTCLDGPGLSGVVAQPVAKRTRRLQRHRFEPAPNRPGRSFDHPGELSFLAALAGRMERRERGDLPRVWRHDRSVSRPALRRLVSARAGVDLVHVLALSSQSGTDRTGELRSSERFDRVARPESEPRILGDLSIDAAMERRFPGRMDDSRSRVRGGDHAARKEPSPVPGQYAAPLSRLGPSDRSRVRTRTRYL